MVLLVVVSMVGEANLALQKEGSFNPVTDVMTRIPMKRSRRNRDGQRKKDARKKRISSSMPRGTPPAPTDDFLQFLDEKSRKKGLRTRNLRHLISRWLVFCGR